MNKLDWIRKQQKLKLINQHYCESCWLGYSHPTNQCTAYNTPEYYQNYGINKVAYEQNRN